MSSKRQLQNNRKKALVLPGVLIITIIAFFPVLTNSFATLDDDTHLLDNMHVRSLRSENIIRIFQDVVNKTYIPLTIFSFAFEYHFFGYNPFVYHLDNLLLHLGVTTLVFLLAHHWGLSIWASAFGALLFGIHPMHVESVAWISERKDVLYAFFYLLSVYQYLFYIKSGSKKTYGLTMVFGFLSILAKPMALGLPLIFFVCDWFHCRKLHQRLFLEKIPLFLFIIPITWITYSLNARIPDVNLYEGGITWAWTFIWYIRKFIFPNILLPVYNLPEPVALTNGEFSLSLIIFFSIISLVFLKRKDRLFIFAFLYFFLSIFFLLRFDNLVDVNIVADRFMYLPSLGFCLFLVLILKGSSNGRKDNPFMSMMPRSDC